jgi:hypothetical protein
MDKLKNFQNFLNEALTLDQAFIELTGMVLFDLKEDLGEKGKEVEVSKYENGREHGYHLSHKGQAVTFSNSRNSGQEVVYFGADDDFESGVLSDEKYAAKNFKYFESNSDPKEITKFVKEKLGI